MKLARLTSALPKDVHNDINNTRSNIVNAVLSATDANADYSAYNIAERDAIAESPVLSETSRGSAFTSSATRMVVSQAVKQTALQRSNEKIAEMERNERRQQELLLHSQQAATGIKIYFIAYYRC